MPTSFLFITVWPILLSAFILNSNASRSFNLLKDIIERSTIPKRKIFLKKRKTPCREKRRTARPERLRQWAVFCADGNRWGAGGPEVGAE